MAFRNHTGWSHNMIYGTPQRLAYYTNTYGTTVYIHSITAKLGCGSGSFFHENPDGWGTGYGTPLYANLIVNNKTSQTRYLSNVVYSNGRKAQVSQCVEYTFTFDPAVAISPTAGEVTVYIDWSPNDTICFDKWTDVTGVVTMDPIGGPDIELDHYDVYPFLIHPGGGYIYNGSEWTQDYIITGFATGVNTFVGTMNSDGVSYNARSIQCPGYSLDGFDIVVGGGTVVKNTSGEKFFFDGNYPNSAPAVYVGAATDAWMFRGDYGDGVGIMARWKKNKYTLTIDPAGGTWNGSSAKSTITQEYATVIDLPWPVPPANKAFVGWYVEGYGYMNTPEKYFIFGPGDTEIQALYVDNITSTLTVDPNGGTMIKVDDITTSSKFDILYNNNTPRFLSSATQKLDETTFKCYSLKERYAFGQPYKPGYLCLDWKVVKGSGIVGVVGSDANFVGHINDSFETSKPVTNGYSFLYSSEGASGPAEIQAQWTPNTYIISYDLNLPADISTEEINSLTAPSAESFLYTDTAVFPKLPDLENYEFRGWNFAPTTIGVYETSIALLATFLDAALPQAGYLDYTNNPITMYAIWVQKGMVNIYLNDAWQKAQVYLYLNDIDGWKRTLPYMYATDSWKQITGG